MTPEFSKLVNPVFRAVFAQLDKFENRERMDLMDVKRRLRRVFDEAESLAGKLGRIEEWRLAKCALVFWADEVLVRADAAWAIHTLEHDIYKQQHRATEFYVKGHREAINSSADVIETWYLALVLGFVGEIQVAFFDLLRLDALPGGTNDPVKARAAWAADLRKHLAHRSPPALVGQPLGDPAWTQDDGKSQLQTAAWTLVAMIAGCGVLLYLASLPQ